MFSQALFVAGLAAAPLALAQFISPPTDLINKTGYAGINVRYKEVPAGICELTPGVKSYSGYADVGKDDHIFFWFFEARKVDPTKAPLAVWINGGPGSSSLIGLFDENGPCTINSDLDVVNNPYSWNTNANVLYVDQPVTTGFSYSIPEHIYVDPETGALTVIRNNGPCPAAQAGNCGTFSSPNIKLVPNSTDNAAPDMWKTIQGFMGAFPQYSRGGFHFATESYGGHYGPVYNEYFEQQNANLPYDAHEIHLESVLIGNGWYDPAIQYAALYNYTVNPGNTYIPHPYNKSVEDQLYHSMYGKGQCLDQVNECQATGNDTMCETADNFCANNLEYVYDLVLNRDEYDIRELNPDPFPYPFFIEYLNSPKVLKAIGAYTNYSLASPQVSTAFTNTGDDARLEMTTVDSKKLLAQGVYVVMYHGDADYICNWIGGEVVSNIIGGSKFASAGYANLSTSDHVVHGQVKQTGNFAFVRIYDSGHTVPFYQPLASLALFNRVIAGLDVETGTKPVSAGLRTTGPVKSTYFEGNKTVQYSPLPQDATYNTTTNEPNP